MISRVAENCYWLNRYIERTESTARLISVNRLSILDTGLHDAQRWLPVLRTVGEDESFEAIHGKRGYERDMVAEDYLTWSEENPVSLRSSLAGARENARTTREVISREMWETLNIGWQWLNSAEAKKEYRRERSRFYRRVLSMCAEFQGNCHSTMLHDEAFDFMRLGLLVERAAQTALVMDVRHHWLAPGSRAEEETPQEAAQWMAILRLCAAVEPFFKRYSSAPTGPTVARFLLQDPSFPRSVLHCLDRIRNFLERIGKDTRRRSPPSLALVKAELRKLRTIDTSGIEQAQLHQTLTEVLASVTTLNQQLYAEFFDPGLVKAPPSKARAATRAAH